MEYGIEFCNKIQDGKIGILKNCFSCLNFAHIQNIINDS